MLLSKYKVKNYTFKEFKERYTENDINLVNTMLEHIKQDKSMYIKLVFATSILLNFDGLIYANDFANSLDRVGNQIIDMLMSLAKWGCLGIGLKEAIGTVLNGGSAKNAINSSLMYLLLYIFISLYPQLFNLFSGIKF